MINHNDCEAFYCEACRTTFSLNELIGRGVELTDLNTGGTYSCWCPDCREEEGNPGNKISNVEHIEEHVEPSADDIQTALFSHGQMSAAGCVRREDGVIEFKDDDVSGDSSIAAALRVWEVLPGDQWLRCSISTCVMCHDEDCDETTHELLPVVTGDDVRVACEKCGDTLHAA